MNSYGGPCIAVEGPIGIFITMYWCVWLCILFLLASLYLGTSNHYMITTLSTYQLAFSDRWSRGTKLWERDCRDLGKQPLVPGTRRDVSGKNCADGNKMEAIAKSWTKYSLQLVV